MIISPWMWCWLSAASAIRAYFVPARQSVFRCAANELPSDSGPIGRVVIFIILFGVSWLTAEIRNEPSTVRRRTHLLPKVLFIALLLRLTHCEGTDAPTTGQEPRSLSAPAKT